MCLFSYTVITQRITVAIQGFECEWQLSCRLWRCEAVRFACSPHFGWWKSLETVSKRALNTRVLWKRLVHFSLDTFSPHTKNTLVHKLQGPLTDKWFILKTLNMVRRKQSLLFPQLEFGPCPGISLWIRPKELHLGYSQADEIFCFIKIL